MLSHKIFSREETKGGMYPPHRGMYVLETETKRTAQGHPRVAEEKEPGALASGEPGQKASKQGNPNIYSPV